MVGADVDGVHDAATKLRALYLNSTQINDAGCAALAAALDGGALLALGNLNLHRVPASDASKAAAKEALERSTSRRTGSRGA